MLLREKHFCQHIQWLVVVRDFGTSFNFTVRFLCIGMHSYLFYFIYELRTDIHACIRYIYNKQLQPVRHGQ